VLNVLGAAAMATRYGIPWPRIAMAMSSYRGVRRRMEIVGEAAGVTVVDDFAHHPTAIRETIGAARSRFPGRRVWALLEPRSNTLRRNVFERQLAEALALADRVILAGVFKQDRIPEAERMNIDHVREITTQRGGQVELGGTADEIAAQVAAQSQPGDVLLVMSNGGFGGIHGKLLRALQSRSS
jgi:UDP-N-acetylmuramate: L-alanyl-gamma-D-glutamyl-meso-diaminopimelate ligase